MRFALIAAAFVASAIAVPVAEPEPAAQAGYGPQTVTETETVTKVKTVTVTASPKPTVTSTETVDPVNLSTTSSKKTSTSSKKTSTSSKKTSTSAKTTSSSTKKTSTSATKTSTSAKTTSTSSKKTSTSTTKLTTSSSVTVDPVSTSATSSKTSTTVATSTPTTLSEIAVYHHNLHRSNHSAPDVKWSASLASIAAKIASSCNYAHNTTAGGGGYGQNIAAGVKANNISSVITDLFYNGEMPYFKEVYYGEANPANFATWGHFSQVVWKDTTTIGCAVQYCPNGLSNTGSNVAPYFTVCNYEPPGNYGGEYGTNIGRPLRHAVAHWNTGL